MKKFTIKRRSIYALLTAAVLAMGLSACAEAAKKSDDDEEVEYPLMTILETTGHHYQLQDDSYEATDTEGGYRHYICDDCGDEYSYETDPLVYTTNPKTGEPVDQSGCCNPYLPVWEHTPDGEPKVFWSKEDSEWRVYVYGSHDVSGEAMCDSNQVVWSAPVYDLSDWRYDGVVLDITDGDPYEGKRLYAPDAAYDLQTDTYFMAANETFTNVVVRVADNPAGPWDKDQAYWLTSFKKAYDPTIYIQDGTIYVAGACRRDEDMIDDPEVYQAIVDDGFTDGAGQICCLFQLKEDPQDGDGVEAISYCPTDETKYLPIYEGASLYGWCEEIGAYLLLYVTNETGADGTVYNSGIGYVWTDDLMNGTWHYGDNGIADDVPEGVEQMAHGGHGNIIADTSGRIYKDVTTGEMVFRDFATYLIGNNHGGIAKINGQWYFNGHRQSGAHMFSRQAIMGQIDVTKNEETGEPLIIPMDYTSSGASDSLDAYTEIGAYTACYLIASEELPAAAVEETNPSYSQIEEGTTPYITATRDEEAEHASYITNLTQGNIIGYKYLDFGEEETALTLSLLVSKQDDYADGTVDVFIDGPSETQDGTQIGTVSVAAADLEGGETVDGSDGTVWTWVSADMDETVSGVHAVYFVFHSEEFDQIADFDEFVFSAAAAQ